MLEGASLQGQFKQESKSCLTVFIRNAFAISERQSGCRGRYTCMDGLAIIICIVMKF